MKIPIFAACGCFLLIASIGFGQTTNSSTTMQMRGSSWMMNPDMKSYNGTATFGPPTFPITVMAGVPFSAEEIGSRTQVLPDGNRITNALPSVFLFRDSAGRTRTERPPMPMAPSSKIVQKLPLIPEIHDPVAGYQYFLDTANHVAHRYTLPPPNPAQFRIDTMGGTGIIRSSANPQTSAPDFMSEPLGTKMIEGILAEGRRSTMTYPPGMMDNDRPMTGNTESWISTDLKVVVLSKTFDPRGGETLRALMNVDRTEPDSKLFQVPPDYKIVDETGVFTITFSGPK